MMLLVSLTEVILYICFSVLFGSFILLLIPQHKKPAIAVPKKILNLAAGLIPITVFFPVVKAAEILAGNMDLWFVIQNVVLTFEVGQSWMFITIITAILIRILIVKEFNDNRPLVMLALLLTFIILCGYTWSSHAATITEGFGFFAHTTHFLAVAIWIGILFIVSWFSTDKSNWMSFLKWYTPVAITCFIIAGAAGYFTLGVDINSYDYPNASLIQEYKNSLLLNYGQALLIKHLLILSLIVFAFLNGLLFRKKHGQPAFNPFRWTRVESVYALLVFGATAWMGQVSPPHQLINLIKVYGASPLFYSVYEGNLINILKSAEAGQVIYVTVSFGILSYLLLGVSFLFMIITILAAWKKASVFVASCSSLLMVIAAYFGILTGIQ